MGYPMEYKERQLPQLDHIAAGLRSGPSEMSPSSIRPLLLLLLPLPSLPPSPVCYMGGYFYVVGG